MTKLFEDDDLMVFLNFCVCLFFICLAGFIGMAISMSHINDKNVLQKKVIDDLTNKMKQLKQYDHIQIMKLDGHEVISCDDGCTWWYLTKNASQVHLDQRASQEFVNWIEAKSRLINQTKHVLGSRMSAEQYLKDVELVLQGQPAVEYAATAK